MTQHIVVNYLNSLEKLKVIENDEGKLIEEVLNLITKIEKLNDLYSFNVIFEGKLYSSENLNTKEEFERDYPIEVDSKNCGFLQVFSKEFPGDLNPDHELIFMLTTLHIGTMIEKIRKAKNLNDSRILYKTIVDNSHEGLSIIDQHFKIIYSNKKTEKIFEEKIEKIIGRDFRDFLTPENKEIVSRRYIERQLGKNVKNDYEFKIITGKNKLKQLIVNSTIIKDSENNIKTIVQFLDVTESKKNERKLENYEKRWRYAIEGSDQGVWDWNLKNNTIYYSEKFKEILGYNVSEFRSGLDEWKNIIHADERETFMKKLSEHFSGKTDSFETVSRFKTKSGIYRWILSRGKVMMRDSYGNPSRVIGTILDINERVENRIRLEKYNRFASLISEIIHETLRSEFDDSIYQIIFDKVISVISGAQGGAMFLKEDDDYFSIVASSHLNKEALKNLCLNKNELVMRDDDEVKIYTDLSINRKLEEEKKNTLENVGRANQIKALLSIPLKSDGEIIGYFTLDNYESEDAFSDENLDMAKVLGQEIEMLLKRIKLEETLKSQKVMLENLSYNDPLTNLPNRRYIMNKATHYLALAKRRESIFCIAYIDLKGFKKINDTYGHEAGDFLLKSFGERIVGSLRESDIMSRIGGDEFVLLLPDTDKFNVNCIMKKIKVLLEKDFEFMNDSIKIGCNIGLAFYPKDGKDFQSLLKKADEAMYSAKREKLLYKFYSNAKN